MTSSFEPVTFPLCYQPGVVYQRFFSFHWRRIQIYVAFKQAVSYLNLSPCIHKYNLSPVYKYMLATSSYIADPCPCFGLGNPAMHSLYILWSFRIILNKEDAESGTNVTVSHMLSQSSKPPTKLTQREEEDSLCKITSGWRHLKIKIVLKCSK